MWLVLVLGLVIVAERGGECINVPPSCIPEGRSIPHAHADRGGAVEAIRLRNTDTAAAMISVIGHGGLRNRPCEGGSVPGNDGGRGEGAMVVDF